MTLISIARLSAGNCPDPHYLNVKLRPQKQDQWCWAASGEMIMRYEGAAASQVSQCRQAKDQSPSPTNPALTLNCCGHPMPQDCNHGGFPDFGRYGFQFQRSVGRALSWQTIQGEFCAGRPVAFSWHFNGCDSREGHMMVGAGYKTIPEGKFVLVLDPLPVMKGDVAWKSYDFYVGADNNLCHWDDFSDIHP
jgi:hypothetical protein